MISKSPPRFGGDWTGRKLEVVRSYLDVYARALKAQPFRRLYVDAFAGTGERVAREGAPLPLLELPALETLAKGSVRLALEVQPPFDEYVFVEKIARRADELERLREDYPSQAIRIIKADANTAVRELCGATPWRSTRGVIFLDPYGMQVSWDTLVEIANTKALDVWLLVPTGIGLRRLLTKDGQIPSEWQQALDRFLGTSVWRQEFYRTEEATDLLGDPVARVRDVRAEKLENFILARLHAIFPVVLEHGVPLTNTKGQAMYLLCFASANPSEKVKSLALRLAAWAAKA